MNPGKFGAAIISPNGTNDGRWGSRIPQKCKNASCRQLLRKLFRHCAKASGRAIVGKHWAMLPRLQKLLGMQ